MRAMIVGLAALLLSGSAQAQETANHLLNECIVFEREARVSANKTITMSSSGAVYCVAYFNAAIALLGAAEAPINNICLPDGATSSQVIRVFLAHARQRPQQLHLPPVIMVLNALGEAFPCRK